MSRTAMRTIVVVLAVLAWASAGSSGATATGPTRAPDVTALFGQALSRVQRADNGTFANSVILEADGVARGGKCTEQGCVDGRTAANAAAVIQWRFVLQNNTAGSPYRSVTVVFGPWPKGFGGVVGNSAPFLEDVPIKTAPKLTLAKAVSRLRHAGHRARFVDVTLRNPLGPKRGNPLYIFGFENKPFVGVDTVTGNVKTIH